jgi:hypothetical protein
MRLLLPEIFEKVDAAKNEEERINILRVNDSPVLQTVLGISFNPASKMRLPEGKPPFKVDKDLPLGYSPTNLYKEARKFYIWFQPSNLSKVKLESLFIEMLESVHWKEADILCAMKDKALSALYKNMTEDLVRKTYPTLLPPAVEKSTESEQTSIKKGRGRPKKLKTEKI